MKENLIRVVCIIGFLFFGFSSYGAHSNHNYPGFVLSACIALIFAVFPFTKTKKDKK